MELKSIKAYSIAIAELRSLEKLYRSSSFAFSQVEEVLRYKAYCNSKRANGSIDKDLTILKPIEYN